MSDNPYGGGEFNPYQAPTAQADGFGPAIQPETGGYWRQGDTLMVSKGATLPSNVCIATGNQSNGQIQTKTLHWAHPAIAVCLIFGVIGLILFMILHFSLRKSGDISYALSEEFYKRRRIGIILAIAGPVASMVIGAVTLDATPIVAILAIFSFFGTLIAGVIMAQPFRIKKIDDQHIHLKLKPEVFQALGM